MAYQPRMTDPVSGKKLQRGKPVANANAAPRDYTKEKTVRPVARIQPPGAFGTPGIDKSDVGRVKDPLSGEPMKKGRPVPAAADSSLNSRIGQNLRAAGGALKAGFKPPVQRSSVDATADKMQQGFDSVRQVGSKIG